MRPQQDSARRDFFELTHRLLEQGLSEPETAQLEEFLRQDPQLRRHFLLCTHADAIAVRYGVPVDETPSNPAREDTPPAGPAGDVPMRTASDRQDASAGEPSAGIGPSLNLPETSSLLTPRFTPMLLMCFIGSVLVTGVLGYFVGLAVAMARPVSAATAGPMLGPTILEAKDVVWKKGVTPLLVGTRLSCGDVLSLASGSLLIRTPMGATLRLQGPASLNMELPERIALQSGTLLVKGLRSGLSIASPTATLSGIDGEARIVVSADDSTEVLVVTGGLDVLANESAAAVRGYQRLVGGQRRWIGVRRAFDPVERSHDSITQPIGLAFGPAGDVYVTKWGTDSVGRFDGSTGAPIDDFVTTGSGELRFPSLMTFGPDGNLYVCSTGNDRVNRYDGRTGAYLDTFVQPRSGGLRGPAGLTFGPDGNLYVSAFANSCVLRYDGKTGQFLDKFVPEGTAGLDAALGISFGPDGHLYVVSHYTNEVLKFDGKTAQFLGRFVDDEELDRPFALRFGPDGHLYVSSFGYQGISKYDSATGKLLGVLTEGLLGAAAARLPQDFAFGPEGDLYVVSNEANAIQHYRVLGDRLEFMRTFASTWPEGRMHQE